MRILVIRLLAVAASYAAYCGFIVAWSYLALSNVVERAFDNQAGDGAEPVRAAILQGAAGADVRLDANNVVVDESEVGLAVRLQWVQPVLTYQGRSVVAVPLSLERAWSRP